MERVLSFTDQRRILSDIFTKSQNIGLLIATSKPPCAQPPSPTPLGCPVHQPLEHLNLPSPCPITYILTTAGLDRRAADKISDAYIRAATSFRADCEVRYSLTSRVRSRSVNANRKDRSAHLLQNAFMVKYNETLDAWTNIILKKLVPHAQLDTCKPWGLYNARVACPAEHHRPFSQHAISILEDIFHRETFPTRLEKERLASETGLLYKQVHTWFQNRRQRSRVDDDRGKDSQEMAALPRDVEASVDALVKGWSMAESMRSSSPNSNPLKSICDEHAAPPHAFPTVYPPQCDYDPFPIRSGFQRFSIPWQRRSSPICGHDHLNPDIATLVEAFSRLSLDDTTLEGVNAPALRPNVPAFYMKSSPAPLPSLISTPVGGRDVKLRCDNTRRQRNRRPPLSRQTMRCAPQKPHKSAQSTRCLPRVRQPDSTVSKTSRLYSPYLAKATQQDALANLPAHVEPWPRESGSNRPNRPSHASPDNHYHTPQPLCVRSVDAHGDALSHALALLEPSQGPQQRMMSSQVARTSTSTRSPSLSSTISTCDSFSSDSSSGGPETPLSTPLISHMRLPCTTSAAEAQQPALKCEPVSFDRSESLKTSRSLRFFGDTGFITP